MLYRLSGILGEKPYWSCIRSPHQKQWPLCVSDQKYAFSLIIVYRLPPEKVRANEPDGRVDYISGAKGQSFVIGIQLYFKPGPVRLTKGGGQGGAAAGRFGKVCDHQCALLNRLVNKSSGRGSEQEAVAACPEKAYGKPQCGKKNFLPLIASEQERTQTDKGAQPCRRERRRLRQDINRQKNCQRNGRGSPA